MEIKATGTFSPDRTAMAIDLEFLPASELEHEMIAAFVEEQTRVTLSPTKIVIDSKTKQATRVPTNVLEGDSIILRLIVDDANAMKYALHNLENRKRKADGRPSIEEEEKAANDAVTTREADQTAAQQREAQNKAELAASKARVEERAAQIIADRAKVVAGPDVEVEGKLRARDETNIASVQSSEPEVQAENLQARKEPDKVQ